MTKTAFITGITGQDGSYLAELLLEKKYNVHGLVRRSSTFSTERIEHIYSDVHEDGQLRLHYGDLTDGQALTNLVLDIEPDEIYNLGFGHIQIKLHFSIIFEFIFTVRLFATFSKMIANDRL